MGRHGRDVCERGDYPLLHSYNYITYVYTIQSTYVYIPSCKMPFRFSSVVYGGLCIVHVQDFTRLVRL